MRWHPIRSHFPVGPSRCPVGTRTTRTADGTVMTVGHLREGGRKLHSFICVIHITTQSYLCYLHNYTVLPVLSVLSTQRGTDSCRLSACRLNTECVICCAILSAGARRQISPLCGGKDSCRDGDGDGADRKGHTMPMLAGSRLALIALASIIAYSISIDHSL
jgi:hypothetical protein